MLMGVFSGSDHLDDMVNQDIEYLMDVLFEIVWRDLQLTF